MDAKNSILIVDDDPKFRKSLCDIIRLQGYAPLAAAKGKTAVNSVKEERPAVALIDLKLPDMNGLEVMREIKKRSPSTECIVLTGYGSQASAIEAVNLGAYGYMQKPYDVQQLVLMIRRAVEKREAEKAVRRAKTEWESTFAAMSDWVTLLDVDTYRVLRTNRAGEEIVGVPPAEMVGQTCCELVHGSEEPIPGCPLKKMLDTHRRESTELHVPDGDHWFMVTVDPVIDEDENIVRATHIVRDITHRKRAEQALRESHESYKELADSIGDVFFAMDKELRYTYWNKASENLTGLSAKDALGKSLYEVFPEVKGTRVEEVYLEVLRTQRPQSVVQEYRVGGKDSVFELSAYPSRDGLSVFTKDITERKRAEEGLEHTLEELRKALGATIQAMALTVEAKDPYTAGHQRRSTNLARAIATKMGLSEEQIDGIRMAGVIHDIGKISVPGEILSKPGRLTDIEFSLIKTHPQVGYDILKPIEFPWPVAQIVLQHHERIDGSGYPAGLKSDEIMLEARILAVADVVEAMCSHRPYRPARSIDEALGEIRQNRGVLYDPEVVDACLSLFRDEGFELEHA